MDITVEKFKTRFIAVFGEKVWEKFNKKFRNKHQIENDFQTIDEIEMNLKKYIEHIDKVKNFFNTDNKHFLRFILICIEKVNRIESRKYHFSLPLNQDGGNEKMWEIEHIIPCKSFEKQISDAKFASEHKHHLSNLTLISRSLNGKENYKTASFNKKKELIQSYDEGNLYINLIFREEVESEEDLRALFEKRGESLKEDFHNIFFNNNKWNLTIFYEIILADSE